MDEPGIGHARAVERKELKILKLPQVASPASVTANPGRCNCFRCLNRPTCASSESVPRSCKLMKTTLPK